jgi:hypothetical protein
MGSRNMKPQTNYRLAMMITFALTASALIMSVLIALQCTVVPPSALESAIATGTPTIEAKPYPFIETAEARK